MKHGSIFIVAGFLFLSSPAHAIVDYALAFDGLDDFVRIFDADPLDLTGNFTVEAWIKSDVSTDSGPHAIATKWNDANSDWAWSVKDDDDSDHVRFELSKGNDNDLGDLEGSQSLLTNDWVHIAVTYDGDLMKIFYNGVIDTMKPANADEYLKATLSDVIIGGYSPGGSQEPWKGVIDEVLFLNYAKIEFEYKEQKGSDPGVIGYWDFNEGSGQTVFDASPFAHHGQLGSTAVEDINDPTWVLSDRPDRPNVVPEPTTMFMVALGSGVLFMKRRRRLAK